MNIRIPRPHQAALRQWFEKDAESAAKIEAAILKAVPSTAANGLGKQLAMALKMSVHEATELAQVFVSMAATLTDIPAEVRADFPAAVVASVYDDETSPPADASARLERLLGAPTLQQTAKALALLHDQQQLFQDCRIITDLRPLFGDDDTELRATTVTHQLRISFDTPSSDPSDFYVALEASDLRKLRVAIDRALAKQASLEAFSKNAGVIVITGDPT
jgi:hypothetical protein